MWLVTTILAIIHRIAQTQSMYVITSDTHHCYSLEVPQEEQDLILLTVYPILSTDVFSGF